MSLFTYIASPGELQGHLHNNFFFSIKNVLNWYPEFDSQRCFENKFIYTLDSRLDYCPHTKRDEIEAEEHLEWSRNLRDISLYNRASLEFLIRHSLCAGEFLEIYSIFWGWGSPEELPPPEHILVLHINELRKSRNFVLDDGYKFIIHR